LAFNKNMVKITQKFNKLNIYSFSFNVLSIIIVKKTLKILIWSLFYVINFPVMLFSFINNKYVLKTMYKNVMY